MYFLYAEERTAYITRSVISDEIVELSDGEYDRLKESILSVCETNTVLLDVERIHEDARITADRITEILTVSPKTDFIVFASGYEPDSRAVSLLSSAGVAKFVTAVDQTGMKEQLEAVLRGEVITETPKLPPQLHPDEPESVKVISGGSIALVGIMPRIGTTTQAIQLCKSILYCGKSVCYIEMNSRGYIDDLTEYYIHDDIRDGVRIDGIDMYRQNAGIAELRERYDFIVCDYGDVMTGINLLSYAEKDHRYLVAGIAPAEQKHIGEALVKLGADKQSLRMIFSFVPDEDRKNIAQQMRLSGKLSWHAAPYTPEPFLFSMENSDMFSRELCLGEPVKKKRFGLFKR